ncbi:MAG: hypothetical protein ACI81T_001525, partial [Bacteroidia bacterium]
PKLKILFDKQQNSNLDEAETKSYRDFFELGFSRENQDSTALVQGESLISLLRFRQWANEKDAPVSGLRLVAGSLVEISVDYFVQVPSALNENSATGQSLKKILTSLDSVNFTSGNVKEALFKQVAPAIFTTAIETVSRLAPEISHDLKVQDFIQTATTGFVEDISGRLEGLQTEAESANVQQWGQWMFRSVIQNAGEAVFMENSAFFTEGEAKSELLKSTGLAMMDILLDSGEGKVDFAKVFTTKSLDSMMQTALGTIGQYPELVSQHDFVKNIVGDLATAIVESDFKKKDLIPELSRLVLEKSAQNIHALFNFDSENPEHLLVTASQQILQSLAQKPEEGKWQLQFSNLQTKNLIDTLLDEVVQNPAWVTSQVNGDSLLSEILNVTFTSLQAIPADERLSAESFQSLVQINVKAVAINQFLLKKLPVDAYGREQQALGYFLDGAFGYLYGDKLAYKSGVANLKSEVLEGSLERLLTQIAQQPITVSLIDQTLKLEFGDIENQLLAGFINSLDGVNFEDGVKTALFKQIAPSFMTSAINVAQQAVPELVDDENFQALLSVTSSQLAQALIGRIDAKANDKEVEKLKLFSSDLMKSLAYNASLMVFSPTSNFFGVSEAEHQLIANTGTALLNSVAEADSLQAVLKGAILENIVQASLEVSAEYPELFTSSEPLQKLVSDLTSAVAESGLNQPNLLPALLQITLEKTALNLPQLWDVEDSSAKNLLVIASQNILTSLSAKPESGKWKPNFSLQQTLDLTGSLLNQVVENPLWVTDLVGEKTILSLALQQTFQALETVPKEKRLHVDSVQLLLTQSVKAVALRQQLLDFVVDEHGKKETILNYAMSSLFSFMFKETETSTAHWVFARLEIANLVLENFMQKLSTKPASKDSVDSIMSQLKIELGKAGENVEFNSVLFLKGFLG